MIAFLLSLDWFSILPWLVGVVGIGYGGYKSNQTTKAKAAQVKLQYMSEKMKADLGKAIVAKIIEQQKESAKVINEKVDSTQRDHFS